MSVNYCPKIVINPKKKNTYKVLQRLKIDLVIIKLYLILSYIKDCMSIR